MSTKFSATVCLDRNTPDNWIGVALFSSDTPVHAMFNFCNAFANHSAVVGIRVVDMDTGEIIFDWWDEDNADPEPSDDDLEMGFNPYLGGYDFDC